MESDSFEDVGDSVNQDSNVTQITQTCNIPDVQVEFLSNEDLSKQKQLNAPYLRRSTAIKATYSYAASLKNINPKTKRNPNPKKERIIEPKTKSIPKAKKSKKEKSRTTVKKIVVPRSVTPPMRTRWLKELRARGKICCPMKNCNGSFISVPGILYHYPRCTNVQYRIQKYPKKISKDDDIMVISESQEENGNVEGSCNQTALDDNATTVETHKSSSKLAKTDVVTTHSSSTKNVSDLELLPKSQAGNCNVEESFNKKSLDITIPGKSKNISINIPKTISETASNSSTNHLMKLIDLEITKSQDGKCNVEKSCKKGVSDIITKSNNILTIPTESVTHSSSVKNMIEFIDLTISKTQEGNCAIVEDCNKSVLDDIVTTTKYADSVNIRKTKAKTTGPSSSIINLLKYKRQEPSKRPDINCNAKISCDNGSNYDTTTIKSNNLQALTSKGEATTNSLSTKNANEGFDLGLSKRQDENCNVKESSDKIIVKENTAAVKSDNNCLNILKASSSKATCISSTKDMPECCDMEISENDKINPNSSSEKEFIGDIKILHSKTLVNKGESKSKHQAFPDRNKLLLQDADNHISQHSTVKSLQTECSVANLLLDSSDSTAGKQTILEKLLNKEKPKNNNTSTSSGSSTALKPDKCSQITKDKCDSFAHCDLPITSTPRSLSYTKIRRSGRSKQAPRWARNNSEDDFEYYISSKKQKLQNSDLNHSIILNDSVDGNSIEPVNPTLETSKNPVLAHTLKNKDGHALSPILSNSCDL